MVIILKLRTANSENFVRLFIRGGARGGQLTSQEAGDTARGEPRYTAEHNGP